MAVDFLTAVLQDSREGMFMNAEINWPVVKKVLHWLRDSPRQHLTDGMFKQCSGEFDFSFEDFINTFGWIWHYAKDHGKSLSVSNESFDFRFDGVRYWLHYMSGGEEICRTIAIDPIYDESCIELTPNETVPGYHLRKIKKGRFGEWSKVEEEFEECLDAIDQGIRLMLLVELSDLIGAIEAYVENKHNMTLKDLRKMAKATSRAFKTGKRK